MVQSEILQFVFEGRGMRAFRGNLLDLLLGIWAQGAALSLPSSSYAATWRQCTASTGP